jgi:hypothetical protein
VKWLKVKALSQNSSITHTKKEIRKDIKQFLDSNENENISEMNLWDTPKAVLTGKLIAMSAHIR